MVRRISVVVLAVVLLAACGQSGSTPEPPSTEPATEFLDPVGPFAVGRRTITMVDAARGGRTLQVDVVYPADSAAAASAPGSEYVFIPGVAFPSLRAKQDVPPAPGPHPVVVYSHGTSGTRFVASFLTEALASYGYIVVAPDHVGDTTLDWFTGAAVLESENARNRPADVSFVIAQMLAPDAGNAFGGLVDAGRVGVIGHSFGGYSGLATVAGRDEIPADPRVRAVVGLAPYTIPLSDAELQRVTVPTMLIAGTADVITPIDRNIDRAWERIPGRPLYRVELAGAGHQSFTDVCAYRDALAGSPTAPDALRGYIEELAKQACVPELLNIETAHRAMISYTVAFLEQYLKGTAADEQFLASNPPVATVEVKR